MWDDGPPSPPLSASYRVASRASLRPASRSGSFPMTSDIRFPDTFLWGASTSAHQVEGSPLADGAGPSIWHRFARTPGMVRDGDTGDVACDHYRRFEDDVRLMRELGLNSYRFSISWSRVLPQGKGKVNDKGLDF